MRYLPRYSRVATRVEKEPVKKTSHHHPDGQYWTSPLWMIGTFIAGVVLAVAHHVYYTKLDGTLVGSAAGQQWPIRFGTTFAFLFKTCLAYATGVAYIQWVWRRFHQQAITIGTINAAFSADRNIFMLLNLDFIRVFPLATGLMVIIWCIPLSSLVTPATLGITSVPNPTLVTVPALLPAISDFDSTSDIVSVKLDRMIEVMTRTGQRPLISAPGNLQNISYTANLIVPLVRCHASDDETRSKIASAAFDSWARTNSDLRTPVTNTSEIHEQNLTFTTSEESVVGEILYYSTTTSSMQKRDVSNIHTLWIAIANTSTSRSGEIPQFAYNVDYYNCSLFNATVTTKFAFVNDIQSLQVINVEEMDELPDWNSTAAHLNISRINALQKYNTFARYLFSRLDGLVFRTTDIYATHVNTTTWNTVVDQTIFAQAKDFSDMAANYFIGLVDQRDLEAISDKNLITMFEDFALNASLALMSNPISFFNKRVPTELTHTLWANKYTYTPKNLFIAYGCSILAALLAVLAGSYAFYTNDESYDNSFSSFGRVLQGDDIAAIFGPTSTNVEKENCRIAKRRIRLYGNRTNKRFKAEDPAIT